MKSIKEFIGNFYEFDQEKVQMKHIQLHNYKIYVNSICNLSG
jgi:hypothetical protein